MTKSNCVDIEGESLSARKTTLNPEICLKVEELLKSTELENRPGVKCSLPHRDDLDCRLFYSINQVILRLNIPESEQDQMFCHLELYELTNQTLTESEFNIMFPLSNIDACFENALQDHNKGCVVFFLNGYRELVRPILFIKEQGFHRVIIDGIDWLGKMIERHHEIRMYFPYCNPCPHNGGKRCQFWDGVFSKFQTICADSNEGRIAEALTQY